MKTVLVLMAIVCLSAPLYGQTYYRYLDLTPTMELLPRAELDPLLVADLICFRLTASGDTLEIVKLDRGERTLVYNFPEGFTVVTADSSVTWTGLQDQSSGYRMQLDELSLPVLLSRLHGDPFQEWVWEDDSTITAYSLDSTGNRIAIDLLPNHTGSAMRLNDQGDLQYFKYETTSATAWQYALSSCHRAVSKRAVNELGEIVPTSDGIAETRYYYDDAENLTSTRLLDVRGNLMPGHYASAVTGNFSFDQNGVVFNEVKVAFTEQLFDENSMYITERHYDTDGNLIENSFGVASVEIQRDVLGGVSESVWLDIEGNRTEIEGISVIRRVFNTQGRVIESSSYNADLEVANYTGGFAYTRFTYAEDGQPELISYYDREGFPVTNSSLGCHARSFVYNNSGGCTELRYLDTSSNLVDLATGYARVVSLFDEDDNLIEHLFFDQHGIQVLP